MEQFLQVYELQIKTLMDTNDRRMQEKEDSIRLLNEMHLKELADTKESYEKQISTLQVSHAEMLKSAENSNKQFVDNYLREISSLETLTKETLQLNSQLVNSGRPPLSLREKDQDQEHKCVQTSLSIEDIEEFPESSSPPVESLELSGLPSTGNDRYSSSSSSSTGLISATLLSLGTLTAESLGTLTAYSVKTANALHQVKTIHCVSARYLYFINFRSFLLHSIVITKDICRLNDFYFF